MSQRRGYVGDTMGIVNAEPASTEFRDIPVWLSSSQPAKICSEPSAFFFAFRAIFTLEPCGSICSVEGAPGFCIFSNVSSICVASVVGSLIVIFKAGWASRYRGATRSTMVVGVEFGTARQGSVAG